MMKAMEDEKFFLVVGNAWRWKKPLVDDWMVYDYLPSEERFGAQYVEVLHSIDEFVSWCAKHYLVDDMTPRRARCVIDAIESASYEIASSIHYTLLADTSPMLYKKRGVDLRRSIYQPADNIIGWRFWWGCDALGITYKFADTLEEASDFLDRLDLISACRTGEYPYECKLAADAYRDDQILEEITVTYNNIHKDFNQKVNDAVELYEEIKKEFNSAQHAVEEMFTSEGDRLAELRVAALSALCWDKNKVFTLKKAKSDLLADRRRERNVLKGELEEAEAQAGFMREAQKIKKLVSELRKIHPCLLVDVA